MLQKDIKWGIKKKHSPYLCTVTLKNDNKNYC
jgi:hypothetical protein